MVTAIYGLWAIHATVTLPLPLPCHLPSLCCTTGNNNASLSGAPLSAANRLHGHRTGAFSWRPELRPYQENGPIPARLYPELHTWKAVLSDFISLSPRTRKMLRHLQTCDQPQSLSSIHTIHLLHPCPNPTHLCHDQLSTCTNCH